MHLSDRTAAVHIITVCPFLYTTTEIFDLEFMQHQKLSAEYLHTRDPHVNTKDLCVHVIRMQALSSKCTVE